MLKEEGPLAGEPVPDKMVKDTAAVTVVPAPVGKHVLLPTKVVPNFESSITEKRVNYVTDSVSVNVANQKEVNVVANAVVTNAALANKIVKWGQVQHLLKFKEYRVVKLAKIKGKMFVEYES